MSGVREDGIGVEEGAEDAFAFLTRLGPYQGYRDAAPSVEGPVAAAMCMAMCEDYVERWLGANEQALQRVRLWAAQHYEVIVSLMNVCLAIGYLSAVADLREGRLNLEGGDG